MKIEGLNVRPIKPADDAEIFSIARAAFEEMGAPREGSVYSDPRMANQSRDFCGRSDAEYWVVEGEDGLAAGGCGFFPTAGLPDGMAEVVKFYFSPRLRGRGVGRRLLSFVEARARQAGYRELYIESFPEFAAAVAMYERHGYSHIGHPLGDSGHPSVTVWMTKRLG